MFKFLPKLTKKKPQLTCKLEKPRKVLLIGLDLVVGKKKIDDEVFEHLYSVLVMSDMGAHLSRQLNSYRKNS